MATGFYLHNGRTVDALFGCDRINDVELEYYEIYQIRFEGGGFEEY
jgi:hypothetical protein